MLRLTVRQRGTSTLLARVVEHDGSTVVLDFGDRALVEDAMRKVTQGGFSVPWEGQRETVHPGGAPLLRHLALHYNSLGYLVELTEHP